MRFLLLGAALLSAGQVEAQGFNMDCERSSGEVLSVAEWTAIATEVGWTSAVHVDLTLENHAAHTIRMIQGVVHFDDILGRTIARIRVDEDARIEQGAAFSQSGNYRDVGDIAVSRLLTADPNDIVATVCIAAFVTGSGEVIRFDE